LSVFRVATGVRGIQAHGGFDLLTITNFWIGEVMTGVWTTSDQGLGVSLKDGYVFSTLLENPSAQKAFKNDGGNVAGLEHYHVANVQYEFFGGNPGFQTDLPFASGQAWNSSGLYVTGAITGTFSLSTNGPVTAGGSISTDGGVTSNGDITGHNLAVTPTANGAGADISGRTFTPSIAQYPGGQIPGQTAACPVQPVSNLSNSGTWPPVNSKSFWAVIRAGTYPIYAGPNVFTFYTNVNITQDEGAGWPDMFFTFHARKTGNLGIFQMSGANRQAVPPAGVVGTYPIQAYDVTVNVLNAPPNNTLGSDLVFFLEANHTVQEQPGPACPNTWGTEPF
jgi:hypothetical protein